jgi:hypothetical protein
MKIKLPLLVLFISLGVCESGCRPGSDSRPTPHSKEASIAPYQSTLLTVAFETASAIPADPHIQDRCLTQEKVAAACLELGQPQIAAQYIEQITDWRRGTGYADLAFYYVQHGTAEADAEPFLKQAGEEAAKTEDWKKDRINVKIARTHAYLGQVQRATELEKDVVPSETGKVAAVQAMTGDANAFDEQVKALDAMVKPGQFDVIVNVTEAYAQLFNRFYADEKRRSLAEERIKASWEKLPVFMRLNLLMEMAGFAVDHANQAKALELVNEAQDLMDNTQWPLEYRVQMAARLSEMRFRAGDKEKAHAHADAVRTLYVRDCYEIVNICRAGALRPLAEAYQAMGDTASALDVYKRALEAGIENPNSRPRAEDLAATCCSMAVHAVDPGPQLWGRIHNIREGLGDPW